MAKECSEASRYESRFGAGFITAAQYLAEGMVAKMARRDKRTLPKKFWENAPWKQHFLNQLRLALSLLKVYDAKAVVRALNTPQGKKIYSLSAPWLEELIQKEQEKFVREMESIKEAAKNATPPSEPTPTEPARPAFVKKTSPLNKLKSLDNL